MCPRKWQTEFLATSLPLNLGDTSFRRSGAIASGMPRPLRSQVKREAATRAQIRPISGNNQSGAIGTVLPAPLVVALTDAVGNPVPDKPVIFKVMQDNGMVSTAARRRQP